MINLRSWADFEKYRDCKRPLIIYSSGAAGRHFLNKNKLKPVYFCDKKASVCREILSEDLDIIKVLTLEELKSYTDGTPLDVIVALTKPEDILSFLKDTENVFSQNTFLYFYHAFNYVSRKPDHFFKDVRINGEYVFHAKTECLAF